MQEVENKLKKVPMRYLTERETHRSGEDEGSGVRQSGESQKQIREETPRYVGMVGGP